MLLQYPYISIQIQIINFDSNNEVVINSNGINFVIVYKQVGQLATTFYNLEGEEQLSRTYPIYGVSSPSITSNSKLEYIICWCENDRIKYQLFGSDFNQQGYILEAESLNTKTDNPDITAFSSGFAIVSKLRLQIFDINGVSQGPSIEVNTTTINTEYPQISTLSKDKFAIIWDGQKQQSDEKKGIFLMKFGSDGSKELIDGIVELYNIQHFLILSHSLIQTTLYVKERQFLFVLENASSNKTKLFKDDFLVKIAQFITLAQYYRAFQANLKQKINKKQLEQTEVFIKYFTNSQ